MGHCITWKSAIQWFSQFFGKLLHNVNTQKTVTSHASNSRQDVIFAAQAFKKLLMGFIEQRPEKAT